MFRYFNVKPTLLSIHVFLMQYKKLLEGEKLYIAK